MICLSFLRPVERAWGNWAKILWKKKKKGTSLFGATTETDAKAEDEKKSLWTFRFYSFEAAWSLSPIQYPSMSFHSFIETSALSAEDQAKLRTLHCDNYNE
jgi:hypothetical protein